MAVAYARLGKQLYTGTSVNNPEPVYPLDPTIAINAYSTCDSVVPALQTVITVIYDGTATTEPTVQLSPDPTFVNYEDVDTIPASATGMSSWVCSIPLMGCIRVKNTSDAIINECYVQQIFNAGGTGGGAF